MTIYFIFIYLVRNQKELFCNTIVAQNDNLLIEKIKPNTFILDCFGNLCFP